MILNTHDKNPKFEPSESPEHRPHPRLDSPHALRSQVFAELDWLDRLEQSRQELATLEETRLAQQSHTTLMRTAADAGRELVFNESVDINILYWHF